MNSDFIIAVLVVVFVLAGIHISNLVYDRGVPHFFSRKIGHGAGGFAFLAALVVSPWTAMAIAATFSIMMALAQRWRPDYIRGIGGAGRDSKTLSEVWFPFVALPVFGISWLWLNQPLPAVASLLFMAWGDGITGLVRGRVYHRQVKGLWGSLAMLLVCLAISWVLIKPLWIGVIASVAATVTEWSFGDSGRLKWADDNLAVPLVSLGIILGLMALTGVL